MRRRIGVDIDGTLCEGKSWRTADDCLSAKPYLEKIDIINELYRTDFIIIYTARQNYQISATLEWLEKNNVHFHAISNKKIPLDCLIDDIEEP